MRKKTGVKAIFLGMLFCALLYFSNNFGLIDIEKTAIITAVGIDLSEKDPEEYEVTVQIAIPQASATSQDNEKAVLSAEGATVSEALHQIGDITGWYPNLSFCNLIVLGEEMLAVDANVCLDYFAKTLKIQYSACVAACEGKAKELLDAITPLDNISSFAIQKILLKNPGMTSDVATVNIKNFSVGYYSPSSSAYMPYIRAVPAGRADGQSGETGGGQSGAQGGGEEEKVFDASFTALFKDGFFVGMLDDHETKTFNLLKESVKENFLIVDDVEIDGMKTDYLLNVTHNRCKMKLEVENGAPVLRVDAHIFARVEDRSTYEKREGLQSNALMPEAVARKAEENFVKYLSSIVKKSRESGCDVLELDNKLYRFNNADYAALREDLYERLQLDVRVSFTGAK